MHLVPSNTKPATGFCFRGRWSAQLLVARCCSPSLDAAEFRFPACPDNHHCDASDVPDCLRDCTEICREAGFQAGLRCDVTWRMAHWWFIHDALGNGVRRWICRSRRRAGRPSHDSTGRTSASYIHGEHIRRWRVGSPCGDVRPPSDLRCSNERDTSPVASSSKVAVAKSRLHSKPLNER